MNFFCLFHTGMNKIAALHVRGRVALFLALGALVCGIATYVVLTRAPFFGNDPTAVTVLLGLDLAFLLMLGSLVARHIYRLFSRRQEKQAGSRLHVRIVSVFTMLAAAPAVLVAMFAAIFFYFGVEAWFSERVKTALDESQLVAQAYLKEHQQVLRADALSMANDLNRQAVRLSEDPMRLAQIVSAQAYLRSLTEVIVFDGSGKILARSGLTFALSFEPITDEMRDRARNGDVVLLISDTDDRVRALLRLDNFVDTYLFVGRLVEPKVLSHMEATERAVRDYQNLKEHSSSIRVMISLIFAVVALLLLLTAVWLGLGFASTLVRPITALIVATKRIRGGDLTARVKEEDEDSGADQDELSHLGRAFNRMADQIEAQRSELVEANRQLDLRRQFTEAVLAGVSAGVIGLDPDFKINMMNVQAGSFFQLTNTEALTGHPLHVLAPEIYALIKEMPRGSWLKGGEVELHQAGKPTKTLFVRLSAEMQGETVRGYIITFDDVSELVAAQRKAAWADVARRIAHEIKNPLTPIQLSAERLRRKYKDEIESDKEVFEACTNTIIRHVEDIGRMVDEFSSFARMPASVIRRHNLCYVCRQTFLLQSTSRTDIDYELELPLESFLADCDERQIAQALTNLLKNAAEAIDGREDQSVRGCIKLTLTEEEGRVVLAVSDNGKGLPKEARERLTEPYMTTRSKGTGLGLAIVKKVMEDHKGAVLLRDNERGGAVVSLIWPRVVE
ncbi:MAG: ATP-binding protein [Bdellovibrionales bacterium]